MEDDETDMFMTSAPSRLPAISNEDWVRVEASKNRFTWVRPRSEVRFLSTWRLSSTYSSERSSRPEMSAAESPSIPSRCREYEMQNLKQIFAVVLVAAGLTPAAALGQNFPASFVYLRDIDPSIIQ